MLCMRVFEHTHTHTQIHTHTLTHTHINIYMCVCVCVIFVAASHQTGLDISSKARRPIKVGINGRGRSGTNRDLNPAGLCCSSTN